MTGMARTAALKNGLVFLSLTPPQAGYWCSRFARRPDVSLIWCGNDQVTETGSDLGYRDSHWSFILAPLNLTP
jgi:hypothetical protein